MLEHYLVNVRRINDLTELIHFHQVTITDWLRLLLSEGTDQNPERIGAHRVIRDLTINETETYSGEAARLEENFRAQMTTPADPNATESHFFWHYITPSELKTL